MNKYTYYRVIQTNHGYGWDDDDWHETDSTYCFKTSEARAAFRVNLKAYQENARCALRVVKKRELNQEAS